MTYEEFLAVVPGYYLVCYNQREKAARYMVAVVPGYYLVCYNSEQGKTSERKL